MLPWLNQNLRGANPGNLSRTVRQTQRAARGLYQRLTRGEATPSELNSARRTAQSLLEATPTGQHPELEGFIKRQGVALLNTPSQTALNQATRSVRTEVQKQMLLRGSHPDIPKATDQAGRIVELTTMQKQAQAFVDLPENQQKYLQHLQNVRDRIPKQKDRERAVTLANTTIAEAEKAVIDARSALKANNSDENQDRLTSAENTLKSLRQELSKLERLGRRQFDREGSAEDAQALDFANEYQINLRRSLDSWRQGRERALANIEQPTQPGQTPRRIDDVLAERQQRIRADHTAEPIAELRAYAQQLDEAAATNPKGRILVGDLAIAQSRQKQWGDALNQSLRSGLQREDGSAVEVDDLQRLQESVAGLRRLRDKHGRIDESIPLDNVVPQGLKLTNPDGSDMTPEQLRSRITGIQDGLERLNVGENNPTLQNLTPKAGAFSGIGWPNQLNAKTIGLTVLGTGATVYGQDQVRDHMDNTRAQTSLQQITTKPATELNTPETQRELRSILTQQTDAAIPILGGQTIGEVSNITRNGNRVQFQAMVDDKPTWFVIGDNGVLVNHTRYIDLVSSGKPREQALNEASVFGNGQGNAFLSNPLRQTPKGDFGINYNGYLNLALGPNIVGIDARPLAEQRYSGLSTNQALRDDLTRNALAQQVTNSNNTLQYVFNGWQSKDGNDPSIVTTRMNPDGSMTIFRRDNPAEQAADVQTVKKEDVAQRLAELAGSMNVVKTQ